MCVCVCVCVCVKGESIQNKTSFFTLSCNDQIKYPKIKKYNKIFKRLFVKNNV